jgi:uncharacterized OB-fold protein
VADQERPQPVKDEVSEPFWAATRRGVLMIQRDRATGELHWPPRSRALPDWEHDVEWVEVSGEATLYTYSVVHRSSHAYMTPPYVLAIVELAGGVHMLTRLVDVDPEEVEIGMPLEVAWEQLDSGDRLPVFQPARRAR